MKKITLSIVAVLAFGFANAQEVKFGVKGGINLSTLTGDMEDASSKVGFQVGGFAEIKLSDKFSVQPELLYSTQGAKEKSNVFDADAMELVSADFTTKLAYINVPVMAKYYVAEKFSLEAGPQIGFLVSAKGKMSGGGDSQEEDIKDFYKSIDFGVNFGAGYDFTENLSAGVRYNLGLSNILENEAGDNFKNKNSVFSLSVGYKF
ncbi:PorT family protein [Flavobacterium sp. LS1R47]|uniref:PorT family protein n=1 Tax=Flavobacterium frigoritolerans TaxID=2987686 RepID=A0A9X3C9N9_9FLAO|nr:porin family protein [Flavobacterium frigoritolerans]MCV9934169.1 PorT family protein [Flavobacterium frigoritolerans]